MGCYTYVNDEDVVHYALEGLLDKYDQVCGFIHHKDTFPDLKTARLMLITEEMRLKSKSLALPVDSFSSSHMVLLAELGSCRFGNGCKFVHDHNAKNGDTRGSKLIDNTMDDLLVKLLRKLGVSNSSSNTGKTNTSNLASHPVVATPVSPPVAFHTNNPTGPVHYPPTAQPYNPVPPFTPYMPAHTILISSIPPGFYYSLAHPYFLAQQYPVAQPTPYPAIGPAQQATSNPASPIQPTTQSGSTSISGQATTLPHAFTDGTLHDPTIGAWNMDTGASSHLNNSVHSLSTVFNSCIMGDLYPVTTPSLIPHAFLVSQHTWHQRLRHPGSGALRRLVSNNVISCNKEKPLVLCHACQLGKHVRL
ncbi:ribonuclease H-like domain-containing protein [Tanacetum coccineum]